MVAGSGTTRREFLQRLGVAGGAGITLGAMTTLGLVTPVEATKVNFRAPAQSDLTATSQANTSVLILGAGIAGLTAMYELEKAGYHCQILEARQRPGGRNWSARRGTSETSLDGTTQTCQFDPGLYMNVGPTRIPQHHTTIDYCRALKIPIHVFNNQNADAYYYFEEAGPLSNQRLRHRAVQADARGYISELLAKAVNQGALNQELSTSDKERLIDFLRTTGVLTAQNKYGENPDRGYRRGNEPVAGDRPGIIDAPYKLSDLFALNDKHTFNLGHWIAFEHEWDQAMPMFEPDGGMDRIPMALVNAITGPIHYGTEVTRIENTAHGVRVSYRDQHENTSQLEADYCICTIPPQILKRIPNNFPVQVQSDLAVPVPVNAGKMGLQFQRRFWELDDRIFGGISMTNMDITQILYPSHGYLEQKGALIGYYAFDIQADQLGALKPKEREQHAITQGSKIHGTVYRTAFESSFSNDWRKTRYSEGAWVDWPAHTQGPNSPYARLLQPVGQVYFAGDHLTYTIAWQHGAFEAARKVVMDLHKRVVAS